MLSIFSCAYWPFVCLLWKDVYSGLHFLIELFLLLSYMSCLYILNMKPLSVITFANIFSHSVACLFVWLVVSFAMPNLLSLIKSHLFIYLFIAFISFALGDRSKKIIAMVYVKQCSTYVFFWEFYSFWSSV